MRRISSSRLVGATAALVALCVSAPAVAQQATTDEAALAVLNTARRAYNEGKAPLAVEKFREFLRVSPNHAQAPWAQYGLALSMLELPQKDYKAVADALAPVIANAAFADRPYALYYAGVAQRGLGNQIVAQIAARPGEAAALKTQANTFFEEARKQFTAAGDALAAGSKPASQPATGKAPRPMDGQWLALARCDQCEMLLNMGKYKEAQDLAAALLADAANAQSAYRPLMLYHLGYAAFGQKDYQAAGKALSQLAPFAQEFGVHARYLLARSLQLGGDRAEAAVQYKAVAADYDARKKAAQESLKNPAALKPEQKAAAEALANRPPPEHVARANFYLAAMQAEDGNCAEALAKLTALTQQKPDTALINEIKLRQGYCQLQLRKFPEATALFQPLVDNPQLGDLACWWLARAQIGAANPAAPPAYEQALKTAVETLRRAADKTAELAKTDASLKVRRADILLEMADTQMQVKLYSEAAATYLLVQTENAAPDRVEQALQRQAAALHLAGLYTQSDELCRKFEKTYPKSTLLGVVAFREAENAFQIAAAAAAKPDLPNREQELAKLFGEAITRYQRVVKQFPDVPLINNARQGMAMSQYRLGRYAEAIALLTAIPEADRSGDLAGVPYLLADCLIRTLPPENDDAVKAAKQMAQAEQAARLLEGFIGAMPKAPQTPDAMLKLANCYQRIAVALADPAERTKKLQSARETCEKCQQQFPQADVIPAVVLERAKVLALAGDANNAANELSRFRSDPLKASPVAPLAVIRLAPLLRSQGKVVDALNALTECRAQYEAALAKDPAKAEWLALLLYEHGVTLKESARLPEARAVFEQVLKQFPARPEAGSAAWRLAQCRREELAAAQAALAAAVARQTKPEESAGARTAVDEAAKGLRAAIDSIKTAVDEAARKAPGGDSHLRLLYELTWCYRSLADMEIRAAREQAQKEALDRVVARLVKEGEVVASGVVEKAPPDVPLSDLPVQPSEKAAMDGYKALVAAGGDQPLTLQARFELAEMLARRNNHQAAIELLAAGLEANPTPEMADRIRLKLAASLLASKDGKSALVQAQAVAKNAASPLWAEAKYLTGEAYIAQGDWAKAIEQLGAFRDQGALQAIPDISDRAMLRLGYACAQAGQWDTSRQAYDMMVQRFPNSVWVHQGRYGLGQALQNLKQYDAAVNVYLEVTKRSASEFAARSQLQIGLCRLEQKNYAEAAKTLMIVALAYDYPDLSAQALCEAGRAQIELKQPDEAAKLWQQVITRYPTSPWAKTAQQRLDENKGKP
ncbi:MAG: tetratricopeptide repeat protein [Phycisphaerae bacterium]